MLIKAVIKNNAKQVTELLESGLILTNRVIKIIDLLNASKGLTKPITNQLKLFALINENKVNFIYAEMYRYYLKSKASLKCRNSKGMNFFEHAATHNLKLLQAILFNSHIRNDIYLSGIKKDKLNAAKNKILANIFFKDNGETVLYLAVLFKKNDILKMLLDNKADLNIQDISGWTALHMAYLVKNHVAADMLMNAVAKSNVENKEGEVATYYENCNVDFAMLSSLKNSLKIVELVNLGTTVKEYYSISTIVKNVIKDAESCAFSLLRDPYFTTNDNVCNKWHLAAIFNLVQEIIKNSDGYYNQKMKYINDFGGQGKSPLYIAIEKHHYEDITALCDQETNQFEIKITGENAIYIALKFISGGNRSWDTFDYLSNFSSRREVLNNRSNGFINFY